MPLETDAHQLLSLLDRGAHRVALAAYRGDVLPDSAAPGVEEFRDTVRVTLREAMLAEASLDVLLAFADTDAGADDVEVLRLCLSMLPARSPKRAGLVARIDRLERVAEERRALGLVHLIHVRAEHHAVQEGRHALLPHGDLGLGGVQEELQPRHLLLQRGDL